MDLAVLDLPSSFIGLSNHQVKLGWLIDLQTDELRLSINDFLGLVEIVGVVIDRTEGYSVEQHKKFAPLNIEDPISWLLYHPVLQPIPLLFADLLPELILSIVRQIGLLYYLFIRSQHAIIPQRIPHLYEPQFIAIKNRLKHSQLHYKSQYHRISVSDLQFDLIENILPP